ncbi:MAG: ComEC family competence protein [Flavobacteriales bacterium]|nr:ComEC family competence protein [Flavobacteriales bacterium]
MALLKGAPFLRILIPLIAGILLDDQIHVALQYCAVALLLSTSALLAYHLWFMRRETYPERYRHGALVFMAFMSLGAMLSANGRDTIVCQRNYDANLKAAFVLARIISAPEVREKSVRCEVELVGEMNAQQLSPRVGHYLIYLEKDSLSESSQYGDLLVCSNRFAPVPPPLNPLEFDYRQYLERKGITMHAYLSGTSWIKVGHEPRSRAFEQLIQLRSYLLQRLSDAGIGGQEHAVLAALILGKTDEISAPLMSAYASSGTVHVLAVSGLHVGLLFLVLSWLLKPLKKMRHGDRWTSLLCIVGIWLYATITGFSPSVLRASVMFSTILAGGMLGRNANIFNTVCMSAFGLIFYDYALVFNAGFQLSYLAVLGIVIYQQKLYSLLYVANKWIDQVWKLTCVSVAAQLLTFPIGFYYFHQFPVYFLLSNLIAVPLSTVILYGCLIMYAVNCFWDLGAYLAILIEYMTVFMNATATWIGSLPGGVLSGVSPSAAETLCLFAMVGFFTSWLFWQRRWHLVYTLLSVCVMVILGLSELSYNKNTPEVCIHSLRQGVGITYSTNDHTLFLYRGCDPESVRRQLQPYWDHQGKELLTLELEDGLSDERHQIFYSSNCLVMGEYAFVLADSSLNGKHGPKPFADLVICTSKFRNYELFASPNYPLVIPSEKMRTAFGADGDPFVLDEGAVTLSSDGIEQFNQRRAS